MLTQEQIKNHLNTMRRKELEELLARLVNPDVEIESSSKLLPERIKNLAQCISSTPFLAKTIIEIREELNEDV